MNKKHIHLIIGLAIIALSLFFAFRGVSIDKMVDAFESVHYVYLIPALILIALSYILRAMRWRYLVRSVKEVTSRRLMSPLMIGFMGNMLPARAGEFIRAYLLSKKENISFSSSFATIFIERLFDLILLLLLLVSVLLFMPNAFDSGGSPQLAANVKYFGMAGFSLCIFIIVFSALLQFKRDWAMKAVDICTRYFSKQWREKIEGMVHSFSDGLKIIKDKRGFLATSLLSVLIWGIFVLTYYPLYLAFGIENQLPVLSSIIVLCLTVAIFITVFPSPGFLGSYQLGCVAALNGIFGINASVAFSFGIVAWLVVMGFTVIVGAIYAAKENISFTQIAASNEQAD